MVNAHEMFFSTYILDGSRELFASSLFNFVHAHDEKSVERESFEGELEVRHGEQLTLRLM